MFLFGKKKETSGLPKQLLDFLTLADETYMKAFMMKSVKVLNEYFSRECCIKLARVVYSEGNCRFFGTEKFRTTTWTVKKSDSEKLFLIKEVVFDKVKVSKSFKMQIADDYSEEWCVAASNYVVLDVNKINS